MSLWKSGPKLIDVPRKGTKGGPIDFSGMHNQVEKGT